MKRKLITQKNSFTLTLPKDWIDSKKLQAGDEVDIKEFKGTLIISSSTKDSHKEFFIDVTNLSDRFIRNLLNQLYILSATKIKIRSKAVSKLIICKKIISLFMGGFEVTQEGKEDVTFELLAKPSEDSFNKYFMKMFNFLEYNFQLLNKFDTDFNLEEIRRGTKKLTQYRNICKKLILNNLMNDIQKVLTSEIINHLTEINHLIFHIFEKKIKLTKKESNMISEMFTLIRKGLLRKDIVLLDLAQKDFVNLALLEKNPSVFSLVRNLYNLSNSSIALIYSEEKQK